MTRQKLYLAGPLFNAAEREQCLRLRSILSVRFELYVPHGDGGLLPDLVASGMPKEVAPKEIFENDISALKACDLLLIVLNGRSIDEGAAFELGVAWSLGKPCFGYKDDFRQLTSDGDNPMIEGALGRVFSSVDELQRWMESIQFREDEMRG